jgi:hypothetical protein
MKVSSEQILVLFVLPRAGRFRIHGRAGTEGRVPVPNNS